MKGRNGAMIIEEIYHARVKLQAEGNDTQDAGLAIVGGSKSTINKYWDAADPATYVPTGARASTRPVNGDPAPAIAVAAQQMTTHANGDTAPGGPTDAEFEASFAVLLDAHIKFFVCQGRHGLPSDHPLVERIVADYDEKYDAHIDLWKQMVEPSPYAYHGWQEPELQAAPPPPPPPALDLTNVRAYYRTGARAPWGSGAPWPEGGVPPVSSAAAIYPLLKQVAQEFEAMRTAAHRRRYDVMNAQGHSRDETPMRQVEETMNAATVVFNRVKSDIDMLEMKARAQGVTL